MVGWWPAFLVSVAVHRFVWQPLERRSGQSIPTILKLFVAVTIYLLAIIGIVGFVFDQKLTGILATSGIIAMIIGLALQINISNIFSGIALNLERPFRIGDWIVVHGRRPFPEESVIGRVVDINWRATRLETTANCIAIIPNSVIAEKTVTNFMKPDEISRFELLFYADYNFDSERVIEEIKKGSRRGFRHAGGPARRAKGEGPRQQHHRHGRGVRNPLLYHPAPRFTLKGAEYHCPQRSRPFETGGYNSGLSGSQGVP